MFFLCNICTPALTVVSGETCWGYCGAVVIGNGTTFWLVWPPSVTAAWVQMPISNVWPVFKKEASLLVVLYEANLCTGDQDVPSYIHYGNTASVHAIEPKAGYLAQKGSRGRCFCASHLLFTFPLFLRSFLRISVRSLLRRASWVFWTRGASMRAGRWRRTSGNLHLTHLSTWNRKKLRDKFSFWSLARWAGFWWGIFVFVEHFCGELVLK